ncbi:MAG TPA: DNA polymerase III subunit delta [Streptosporangiaceae bacterium]|nr:DNA polymerase III subunit delta [Streptosporangiaceae bacterium]
MAARSSGESNSAAITVIVGEEDLLVERAVKSVLSGLTAGPGQSEPDVHEVRAADLATGELGMLMSPSLFGGETVVIVRGVQDASAAIATELGKLAADLPPEVTLVITHSGGAKHKALLTALSGARRIDCPAVRRFGERMEFLRAEFARAGRKADDGGLRALLDGVGTDLRDLAAACDQLASDITGVVTAAAVAKYWRGRAEATGFSVADRALEGNLTQALAQLRWALAVGTAPVLITSALARGLRTLGQVGSASRRKSGPALASELGMPPWMIDKARQQLRGWSSAGLARAHCAVALADAQVKGEGASAGYALEHVLRVIAECRSAD